MFREKDQKLWEKIKPMGMRFYLIRTGVLRVGLVSFILLVIMLPLLAHVFSVNYFQSDGFRNMLIILGMISPLYGALMAYSSSTSLEKKFG